MMMISMGSMRLLRRGHPPRSPALPVYSARASRDTTGGVAGGTFGGSADAERRGSIGTSPPANTLISPAGFPMPSARCRARLTRGGRHPDHDVVRLGVTFDIGPDVRADRDDLGGPAAERHRARTAPAARRGPVPDTPRAPRCGPARSVRVSRCSRGTRRGHRRGAPRTAAPPQHRRS